ncbi:hypothetical protein MJO28_008443, partial [Puccinia striiformis f. sp. tritici]
PSARNVSSIRVPSLGFYVGCHVLRNIVRVYHQPGMPKITHSNIGYPLYVFDDQDCVPLNDLQVLLDGPTGGSATNYPLMSTEENSSM